MCFSVSIERNLSLLADMFRAKVDKVAFERFLSQQEQFPHIFKGPDEDDRIYPQTFAPVIQDFSNKDTEVKRVIRPMRYRVRPHNSFEEVPSKFNLFNARLDSLEQRKTWRPLFGYNHVLVPLKKFYEWGEVEGQKKMISFSPADHELMVAPGLFDTYHDGDKSFSSFAIITTDPPQDVLDAGHDRCPILLKEKYWDSWLRPQALEEDDKKRRDLLYAMLHDSNQTPFSVKEEGEGTKKSDNQLDLFNK